MVIILYGGLMEYYQIYSKNDAYYKIPLYMKGRIYFFLEYSPNGNRWKFMNMSVHSSFKFNIEDDYRITNIDELPKFIYAPLFNEIFGGLDEI